MTLTGRVPTEAGALERTEWLYTRGDESVRVDVRPEGGIYSVVVLGPGAERQIRAHRSQETLDAFLSEFEQDLGVRGFRLMAVAERRQEGREPDPEDPGTDRRRNHA